MQLTFCTVFTSGIDKHLRKCIKIIAGYIRNGKWWRQNTKFYQITCRRGAIAAYYNHKSSVLTIKERKLHCLMNLNSILSPNNNIYLVSKRSLKSCWKRNLTISRVLKMKIQKIVAQTSLINMLHTKYSFLNIHYSWKRVKTSEYQESYSNSSLGYMAWIRNPETWLWISPSPCLWPASVCCPPANPTLSQNWSPFIAWTTVEDEVWIQ